MIDKTTLIYAVVALAILFIVLFIASNLRSAQGMKKTQVDEDVEEAHLDAVVGARVDPAPLSTPEKNP